MKTSSLSPASRFAFCAWQMLLVAWVSVYSASDGMAQGKITGSDPAAESRGALSVKNLIGSAVSLANRDYPEIDNAIRRFRNGDVQGAIEYLNQAGEKYPGLPPADITLAKMHGARRNAQAVRFLLERAVVQHPEDPEAILLMADQAFMEGRTTDAEALFELADPIVQEFSGNERRKENFVVRVVAGRSAVAERRQQWDKAVELLNTWLEIDPDSVAAHQRLGVAFFRLKKHRDSLAEFSKARELSKEVAHPYVIMGQLLSFDGDNEKAKKAFERAYKEDVSDDKVAQAYAEWLIQQGELEDAQAVAATLREQSPDSVVALLLDGVVAQMQGDSERAEEALIKTMSIDPSNARATNFLALLLIESDDNADRERALRYAQVNAQRFENSPSANVTLGWVLFKLGRMAEAQSALKKGAQSGQLQSDSAYLVAKIMSDQESQKENVIQTLKQVLRQKQGLFIYRREAEQLLKDLEGEKS